ncbi:hypothetical protein [Dyadobacter sp. CY347]|uniref:hypothetical protein n=1 Tax=Dyadobacter sp. CY347 TaxID=2909336 RepID=UPI001F1B547E|nr:hypothetical protein [Dyadobacter sp. CY347]MCF2487124.1 hypothetical protein [Dyadobacter sp. CY347]
MNIRASIFVTLLFVSLFSCKDDDVDAGNNGLVGKWKMTEYLFDPGDGSGKFQRASEGESSVVEFKANGDFKETRGSLSSYVNLYTKYKLIGNDLIELSGAPNSVAYPAHNWSYKDLTPTSVTLGFSCDGTCLGKFVAVE